MGFNQCYLKNVKDLESELANVGLETFVKRYQKYDSITGSSESFKFLEQKITEYENNTLNNTIDITNGM
jgi:predicted nucleotidyltransferase